MTLLNLHPFSGFMQCAVAQSLIALALRQTAVASVSGLRGNEVALTVRWQVEIPDDM